MPRIAYCLMIDSLMDGPVPSLFDAAGRAWTFASIVEARKEIADLLITRLQEFSDGERDYEDAVDVEEYIAEVSLLDDEFAVDESGRRFRYRLESIDGSSSVPSQS